MTNSPSFFITAGLNVPADSKPSPRGDMTGSGESRAHVPKGKSTDGPAIAATAVNTRSSRVNFLARKTMPFISLRIVCILFQNWTLSETNTSTMVLPFEHKRNCDSILCEQLQPRVPGNSHRVAH